MLFRMKKSEIVSNFFLETLDSTLPAYESVTASLRLILVTR